MFDVRNRAFLILSTLVAVAASDCNPVETTTPPPCPGVTELAAFKLGMTMQAASATGALHSTDGDPNTFVRSLPPGSRFQSIRIRFDSGRAIELAATRYFDLPELSRLSSIADDAMREVALSLGRPDEVLRVWGGRPGSPRQMEMAVWRRKCGWVLLTSNTDDDVKAVQAAGRFGEECWVSVVVVEQNRGAKLISSFRRSAGDESR